MNKWMHPRWVNGLAVVSLLAGCGGGGGATGTDTTAFRAPPDTLVSDITPQNAPADFSGRNYFPLNAGDTWVYDMQSDGQPDSTVTLTVLSGPDAQGQILVRETSSTANVEVTYRRTAQGLTFNPLSTSGPAGARQLVGDLLAYPEQVDLLSAERIAERAGTWDRDEDGDGHPEGFRVGYRSLFLRVDAVPFGRSTLKALNQRSTYRFSLIPSNPSLNPTATAAIETVWAAPGLGVVKATRILEGVPSVRTPQNLTLRTATVNGKVLPRDDDAVARAVNVTHSALVFDATRNLYYASVPARVAVNGNRIAIIDAITGTVRYSEVVGLEPGALALANDGSRLYVSLTGSKELLGLSLPDMIPVGRVTLPETPFAIPASAASAMAVSPTDPAVVAVAVWNGTNNDAASVVLLRNFVAEPRQGPRMSGKALVAFSSDGGTVFASDGVSLQRLAVLPDGLQTSGAPMLLDQRTGTNLTMTSDGLVHGNHLFAAQDLSWQGSYALSRGICASLAQLARVACLPDDFGLRLVISGRTSQRVLFMPSWSETAPARGPFDIVAGPAGQVALRLEGDYLGQAETLLLVDGTLLRP